MLSIGAMGKASGGAGGYYLNLAREDYYTEGGEPPGQWRGRAAAGLGLGGQIERSQLTHILSGHHPQSGKPLVQKAGPDHRAGWDLTFSAPKGVSVLWSQADPQAREAIQAAQQAAVDRAIAFVQDHAAYTRRGHGGAAPEPVAGLVVASFEHSTSREQDPQLHTHCLIANLAPRGDGGWGSLESRYLYQWKMAAGALYRAELAQQLCERLDLDIQRDQRSFRIHGVPQAVEREFSKRAGQIQDHLHNLSVKSAAAAAVAALDSREKKDAISRPDLFVRWHREGAALGFGPEAVQRFLEVPPRAAPLPALTPKAVLDALTETTSTFSDRDLWRAAAEGSQGVSGAAGVAELVDRTFAHPELVRLGKDDKGNGRYSTQAMVDLERDLVERAAARRDEGRHRVARQDLLLVLEGRTLSQEQTGAVRHLTQGAGGVACVVGMAGTGKSYALDAARQIWEKAGLRVSGAALSGKAAQGLQASARIPSTTLQSLLTRLDSGEAPLGRKDVIVIDEAGMVGSRQMHRLLEHARQAGAKVALIGDHRQLQPIDAGSAFRVLKDRLGAPALTDIRRQREAWAKDAVHRFADGDAATALASYHVRGLLTMTEDRSATMERMAQDWMADRLCDPEGSSIMLASTRQESNYLNEAARRALQARGELDDPVSVATAHGSREFAVGDRLLFTRNSALFGVRNGTLGTVERIGLSGLGELTLHARLDDGRLTSLRPSQYPSLDHGYALTTHKAQGVTVDRAYVLTGGPMADRELTYVQMSRHRDRAHLYVDRATVEELLREAAPTKGMKNYAKDLAGKQGLRLPDGYEVDFVVCRDFLNAHGGRVIDGQEKDPTLRDLQVLARTLNKSRQKDTTLDYAPGREHRAARQQPVGEEKTSLFQRWRRRSAEPQREPPRERTLER